MEKFIKYTDSYNVTTFGPFIACLFVQSPRCVRLCNPKDCSTPGFPVPHHLPEFAQIHVYSTGDVIQSVTLFPFCFQSFPASGSFPTSQLFTSGGQSVGASASASVFPMSILLHICFLLYQFLSLSFWFLFFYLGLLYCPFTNFMRQMLSFLISSFLFCNEYPTFPSENGPCCSLWLS